VLSRPSKIEFYEAADGRRLAVRVWSADEIPAARIVCLHGITSHGGWYDRCCEYLAGAGFESHFLDRRGSGLNAEQPGDVDSWQTWLDDVGAYLRTIRHPDSNEQRRLPVVLCGISWGGKLAAAVARRFPGFMNGLALVCPGIYSPYSPGRIKRLALRAPVPSRWMSRRVRIPLRRPQLFTDSPAWRKFIADDPLTLREVTWRFAREDRRLSAFARVSAPFLHMPLLVVLAGRDRIVNNRRTRRFFGRAAAAQKTLHEYSNAAHTLEFEFDPTQYFSDFAAWVHNVAGTLRVP
jgi:alpha-beta hydrolase superfamily lysophospholipase